MEYTKNAKSIADIILMLQSRGLVISDTDKAADLLKKVSYFRFAAYLRPLEIDKDAHTYKPGAKFETAASLYHFDASLRMLVFSSFQSLEIASFGILTKFYFNFADSKAKKVVAREFNLPQHEILESWLRAINSLRNCCAHHNRIWNRNFAEMPQLPRKLNGSWLSDFSIPTYRLFAILSCTVYCLNAVSPDNTFVKDFKALLAAHPEVDVNAMGFPAAWQNEPLWK